MQTERSGQSKNW